MALGEPFREPQGGPMAQVEEPCSNAILFWCLVRNQLGGLSDETVEQTMLTTCIAKHKLGSCAGTRCYRISLRCNLLSISLEKVNRHLSFKWNSVLQWGKDIWNWAVVASSAVFRFKTSEINMRLHRKTLQCFWLSTARLAVNIYDL